ncbi:hypothetical protein BA059_16890 [Mycolicibacterium sp. (ex Dasyatis americana)]|nr:hypothetical protein BA059_16890 [Mycolicibacterium sp. (ex Dasyatis americana)]
MAKYKVVSPGPVQGGRAWQVGDVVELSGAQAAQYAGKVRKVDEDRPRRKTLDGIKRTVRDLGESKGPVLNPVDSEPEGDGE